MPSIGGYFKQPLSRVLVPTQNQGGFTAYYFAESDFSVWFNANLGKITYVGGAYMINGTTSGSTFTDVVLGDNGATELDHTLNNIDQRKTLVDMGKEIIIGNSSEPRLLVFRRVMQFGLSTAGGDGQVGYVVVENNAVDLGGNAGRFTVRVARI